MSDKNKKSRSVFIQHDKFAAARSELERLGFVMPKVDLVLSDETYYNPLNKTVGVQRRIVSTLYFLEGFKKSELVLILAFLLNSR